MKKIIIALSVALVILLLLLMAGDCQEDRNHVILTIALYFLM